MDRRQFLASAASLGIVGVWATRSAAASSRVVWREDRASFPQGVASGDPDDHSVVLWTRRPFDQGERQALTVEVARDADFRIVVARARAPVLAAADWTCRALVGGLLPATTYWYRFTDDSGAGSRVGRTITAPRATDPRPVRFAFVSCNSVNEGAQNAFRRMIWEDERAPADRKLGFVLHLGDFIYEVVEYPDEVPHRYSRTVYDLGRIPDGRKVGQFPRADQPRRLSPCLSRAYRRSRHPGRPRLFPVRVHRRQPRILVAGLAELHQIRQQDRARAAVARRRQPGVVGIYPVARPQGSGPGLDQFGPPAVTNAPIDTLDDHGFGAEANNRTAIGSMTAYRALRYGRHVELILTDFHSYTMQNPGSGPKRTRSTPSFPVVPQELMEIIDAGKDYAGGNPPATIAIGDKSVPNFRKAEPAYTVLGREQKAWLKERLTRSTATWKIWGATNGTLDMRTDPQNLPAGLTKDKWPGKDYGTFGGGDFSGAFSERAEIYDTVRDHKLSGFVIISGDRHRERQTRSGSSSTLVLTPPHPAS